ncbi:hypothetical protein CONPUDRAFT_20633, partial [Coniophora puteana RWD-64-598 SS2]
DDLDDLLLSCRYGDLDDVRAFIDAHGPAPLSTARDALGNSVIHMCAANGHPSTDILTYLLPLLDDPATLLSAPNAAQSTPLHWAALNRQLPAARALVECPRGPGAILIDAKNAAGRTPLGEAELAGWDEGAQWFVEVMSLDEHGVGEEAGAEDVPES